jgi:alpha-D-xyloside xylohydrolase
LSREPDGNPDSIRTDRSRDDVSGTTSYLLHHEDADHWVRIEPWGADSVRVRAGRGVMLETIGALLPPSATATSLSTSAAGQTLVNGLLRVELSAAGELAFVRDSDGVELLAEQRAHFIWPGARVFSAHGNGYYRLEQRFRAYRDEQIFGLGQHQHGRLDQKGLVLDLVQRNADVSIPFLVSSRGYGFLWNQPAVGRVELASNATRWVADSARQIDYWVTAANGPAGLLSNYADATGHAPQFPSWAAGLWQSKLRYRTQDELLDVAREYHRRGLPLDVIVADYFHWTHLGDWQFDPEEWPDPDALTSELDGLGVRLLVSVWPSVSPLSENNARMRDAGHLVGAENGIPIHHLFPDKGFDGKALGVSFYDPTSESARDFIWDRVKAGYYDHGVRLWWLDGCEPEIFPEQHANLRYAAGPGTEVANVYPREHVRGFYEHMQSLGETEIVCLVRSAWAGSQRYGALLWSGDIATTYDSLRTQIAAGLNAGLSGIPWWTTDIGGFHGGDPDSDDYRELLTRWFQYAVFCPVLRMHGHREPREGFSAGHSGGGNELWSYGEETYDILASQLRLRERLRPYVLAQLDAASRTGMPPMRPLFVDVPEDRACWTVADQFFFGPELLVAPIVERGARRREVYLPKGRHWVDAASGAEYAGGQMISAEAPIERIPVFCSIGSQVRSAWDT